MKTKIYQSPYHQLWYDSENTEIESTYFETTSLMSDEEYVHYVLEGTTAMEQQNEVHYLLIDFRKFDYPISPEIQIQIVRALAPRWIKMGMKKVATLLPTEFIAEISVEQMGDYAMSFTPYQIAYFDTPKKAREWFYTSK